MAVDPRFPACTAEASPSAYSVRRRGTILLSEERQCVSTVLKPSRATLHPITKKISLHQPRSLGLTAHHFLRLSGDLRRRVSGAGRL